MARPAIKNLNDLNDYLSLLEDRIAELENQDQLIKSAINDVNQDLQETVNIEYDLPRTGLLSHNFFTRAFSVWGHYFVASLIIGLVFTFIYLVVAVEILGSSINFLSNFGTMLLK